MGYLLASSILWSLSFGLIQAQLKGLDPYAVSLLRLSICCIAFSPWIRRLPWRDASRLAAVGMIQFGLMYCLYIQSYRYLQGHEVALLTITTPLLMLFFDRGMGGAGLRPRHWLSALLAVSAAYALVSKKADARWAVTGVLLVQGANACFALGQLLYRRARPAGGQGLAHFGWLYLGATAVPAVFLALSGSGAPRLPLARDQWLSLLYLGLVPSGVAFYLWNQGVARVRVPVAAVMNNAKVPLAVLASWAVFGERLDLPRVAASLGLFAAALALAGRARQD